MVLNNPKSIAIVGASKDRNKIGAAIMNNLLNAGYGGKIYPVNPKYDKLFGAKCYPDLLSIDAEVDVVIVAIPAHFVTEIVKESAQKQAKEVIIISAGFSEIGESGLQKEAELLEIVRETGIRILGPNCLGVIIPEYGVNASFAAQTPKPGNIAFLSQSGAFNTAMLDKAAATDLGFSHFISIGNKIDINELDFLDDWIKDDNVSVIGMYLEEFAKPRQLLKLAEKSTKPIIILNPGKSEAAKSAISSHTGSLAGDDKITAAALAKVGIIQISSIEEMFVLLRLFSLTQGKAISSNVAILTNAGGPGIVATDLIDMSGMQIASLSEGLQGQLASVLPEAASTHNPIDLLGDADETRYKSTLEILVNSPEVETIVLLLTPQYMTKPIETARQIIEVSKNTHKLILPLYVGGEKLQPAVDLLEENDVPVFTYLNDGINALAVVARWHKDAASKGLSVDLSQFGTMPHQVDLSGQTGPLNYELTNALANQAGIELIPEKFSNNVEELKIFAEEIGYPVVIKATTDQIVHKTDTKAIFLNIQSGDELVRRFTELQSTISGMTNIQNPPVLLQKQLSNTDGLELIVGINRSGDADVYKNDSGFGHLMLVGTGGIYTEIYQDVATSLLPLDHHELQDLIMSTKAAKIITGARGHNPLAMNKLIELIGKLQLLVLSYPEISSIDINPVLLTDSSAIALDLKIFI